MDFQKRSESIGLNSVYRLVQKLSTPPLGGVLHFLLWVAVENQFKYTPFEVYLNLVLEGTHEAARHAFSQIVDSIEEHKILSTFYQPTPDLLRTLQ